jgi:L-amino acid N-acyltransferase YncA
MGDATAIAATYNEGIADRTATFETEPRSAEKLRVVSRQLVMVAQTEVTGPVGFAASFPYSSRACYRVIGEFSVYVGRNHRGRGASRVALGALIETATGRGMHKLTSRVISGEHGKPRPTEMLRFRRNWDSPAARAIGRPLARLRDRRAIAR